jgi:exosortase/archaeosortase family protein
VGIVAIHIANLVRVISLVILNFYRPSALAFNHDYTWTVLVYGFIFWLWYLWTDKLSRTSAVATSNG